jgi:hypothetical protein
MTNQRAFGLAPLPPLARGATANGHRSHPLSGHPVSLVARCGKATFPEPGVLNRIAIISDLDGTVNQHLSWSVKG